ncbi:MAG TPA: hypothetical protein VLD58_03420, partial [Gemmatimonadales bacterium]|nr:hypothetical protein [Gemmatimonadales bacterium]
LGFVGLHFLYAMSSGMIHGVGRDAEYLADAIAGGPMASRVGTPRPPAPDLSISRAPVRREGGDRAGVLTGGGSSTIVKL